VKARRVSRNQLSESVIDGSVLCRSLRDANGRVAFGKGRVLARSDVEALCNLPWDELHLVDGDEGELHELEAGRRLVRAAVGRDSGLVAGEMAGGQWPVVAALRGLLMVRVEALAEINRVDALAVYTLADGQVVEKGDTVARAKIIPFLVAEGSIVRAEELAEKEGGLLSVRGFAPARVGAIVQESLGSDGLGRFGNALSEKLRWFGSELLGPRLVQPETAAILGALRELVGAGVSVIVMAGSSAMDPLDPAFEALRDTGATIERHGVPAHPGSLLWLARLGPVPVVGMPSCGLFSRATVFDLVLPRLLAGARVDHDWFANLGHGGLLTRDMASRFPPYRATRSRGSIE
jgi:hypothetical protein